MAEYVGTEPADRFDVFAAILDLRPSWHRHAACRGGNTHLMFPKKGRGRKNLIPYQTALELCGDCTVRPQCEDAGKDETNGVWAGKIKDKRMERPTSVATILRNYQPWTSEQLQQATNRDEPEVRRQLSTLIKNGFVTIDVADDGTNIYTMKGTNQ